MPLSTQNATTLPGGSLNGTATAGAPGLFSTVTPAGTTGSTGASDVNATGTPAATTDTTGVANSTGTPAATNSTTGGTTGSGTTAGGSNDTTTGTATPAASTGTGAQNGTQAGVENGLVRLSTILQSAVTTGSNQQAGQVRGVLLTGPAISGKSGNSAGVNVQGPTVSYVALDAVKGNDASGTQATIAPTAASSQGDANRVNGESWSKLAGQNDLVLVPWQAFNFSQAAGTTGVSTAQTIVDTAALAAAPHFSAQNPPDFASANWNAAIDQYWVSQGTGVPVTGTSSQPIGQPVLLNSPFTGINVNLANGQTAAQVQDFLVNPTTGVIEYVVLSGAGLGQQLLPVPAGALNWNQVSTLGAENGLNMPKNFTLGVSDQMINQAPLLDTINNLGADSSTWRQSVDQYWQDFLHTGSEKVK